MKPDFAFSQDSPGTGGTFNSWGGRQIHDDTWTGASRCSNHSLGRVSRPLAAVGFEQLSDLAAIGPIKVVTRMPFMHQTSRLSSVVARWTNGGCELRGSEGAVWLCPRDIVQGLAVADYADSRSSQRRIDYFDCSGRVVVRIEQAEGGDPEAFDAFCTVHAADETGWSAGSRGRAEEPLRPAGTAPEGSPDALRIALARVGIAALTPQQGCRPANPSGLKVLLRIADEHGLALDLSYIRPGCVQRSSTIVTEAYGDGLVWRGQSAASFELSFDAAQITRAWIIEGRSQAACMVVTDAVCRAFVAVHLSSRLRGAEITNGVPARWPAIMSYLVSRPADSSAPAVTAGRRA